YTSPRLRRQLASSCVACRARAAATPSRSSFSGSSRFKARNGPRSLIRLARKRLSFRAFARPTAAEKFGISLDSAERDSRFLEVFQTTESHHLPAKAIK